MAPIAGGPVTKCIQGLLRDSDERIFLSDLLRAGGRFSSSGISFDRFRATNALIGRPAFPAAAQAPQFDTLEVPLQGFEEWLRLGSIELTRAEDGISASYVRPGDLTYDGDDGSLTIAFDAETDSSYMQRTHSFTIKESASLRLRLRSARSLSELHMQYGMIEDLLILLTGSDYRLAWPKVSLAESPKYRWFFPRLTSREPAAAPELHDVITNFSELRDQFGSIWSRWKAKREEFGPGFYLYLGTRRGMQLYVEHRFVHLIWGLEAFHRKNSVPEESDALAQKIERIIKQVAAAKDKKWLRGRLKTAHEPALGQRLFEVFAALPIGIDKAKLRKFSDECATLRNQISHFGGAQHGKPYFDFVRDLHSKSSALSTLYHALLLHEIGVDASILKRWTCSSFGSYPIKVNFVEVGLLDPSVLQVHRPRQGSGGSKS